MILISILHCQESTKQHTEKIGSDEEGRSRQRIQTFAAKRYASAIERNPDDYDALYNWALVLQNLHNYTVARDTFLAHVGATFWGSMRHIISPSLADRAFHHYEKISFQLLFITQEKVRHIK
ncbi:unnamed protein product [Lactuca virosa]|uniref:Uncharacterized protein n=1 Tax=Lactuca virosa TaxID=75947 RepID=A0AAU9MRL7_9ASTR|nr:unnamed protein product [Lactuca virosa]